MSEYRQYPWHQVLMRRVGVVLLGIVAFPIMIFLHEIVAAFIVTYTACG